MLRERRMEGQGVEKPAFSPECWHSWLRGEGRRLDNTRLYKTMESAATRMHE